jgi:hydroxymethylpyrimidine/phosphomethylpyrimidine kinase
LNRLANVVDDALADALIETDNMTSWQGQRIDTTSTHGTGCTLASAIAVFLAQGSTLADAVSRAREFVRVALHEAPGLGQGAGPIGQAAVRLDAGSGPRLNQVTVTGTNYERSIDFYRRLGLEQIVDSPDTGYARFETAGGVTLSVQIDPDEKIIATTAIYLECDDLDERVEQLARSDEEDGAEPHQEAGEEPETVAGDPQLRLTADPLIVIDHRAERHEGDDGVDHLEYSLPHRPNERSAKRMPHQEMQPHEQDGRPSQPHLQSHSLTPL